MRSHYNDAGADCFSPQNFTLEPYSTTMIPLGFSIEVPDGYMAVIKPRSSMNVKGIITQIGTIDSGYRGEVKAVFVNPSNETFKFYEHDKICQIVLLFISSIYNYSTRGGESQILGDEILNFCKFEF